jgi:16S rRNA (cytosine1402-N4)-methyltransferase
MVFDLGLSSLQIDEVARGFAYAADAPLSMRMDGDDSLLTAADVVNTYSAQHLARVFRDYGEETFANRIAQAIVAEREHAPFTTSARLSQTIVHAIPTGQTRSGHPAKRVFQAIRIEVNDERGGLERALPQALDHLALHGRLAVLSYHSGEDRLVKQAFARASTDQVPPGVPLVPVAQRARFATLTRGAQQPTAAEIGANPRARSARLRVIERIEEQP